MKIKEIITEPSKVEVGSVFKLKIKAIRYVTYQELATLDYEDVDNYTYGELRGD